MGIGDFTDQAAVYGGSRPNYPSQLIDLLVSEAAVKPGDAVVDLGAGTGIFTAELVKRGFIVSAVEPNERMRSSGNLSTAVWIDGTFEATQLKGESQDWAVAAQAFHWADSKLALPEVRRILKPGRVFSVFWNEKDMFAVPILRWTRAAILRHIPDFHEHYDGKDWRSVLESTGNFEFVECRTARHSVLMSRERFLNLWRSHHWMQQLAKAGAFSDFLAELEAHLIAEDVVQIELPYDCNAWTARRVN